MASKRAKYEEDVCEPSFGRCRACVRIALTCNHVVGQIPCHTQATRTQTVVLQYENVDDLRETNACNLISKEHCDRLKRRTSEIKPAREGATAARNGAHEVCLIPSPTSRGSLSCRCCDLLFFHLKDWGQPGHRWESREL